MSNPFGHIEVESVRARDVSGHYARKGGRRGRHMRDTEDVKKWGAIMDYFRSQGTSLSTVLKQMRSTSQHS